MSEIGMAQHAFARPNVLVVAVRLCMRRAWSARPCRDAGRTNAMNGLRQTDNLQWLCRRSL